MPINPSKFTIQKTDPRDARNIGLRLQTGVLKSIHIPDEQQEADRVLFRHRKRIWKDLTRCKNRIKGLLAFSGIDIPEQTQRFSLLPSHLDKSRFKITNAGAILPNGNAIIAGDGKYVEVFDVKTGLFHTVKGNLESAYMYPTVTPLLDGQILITGGYDGNMIATNGAWLYKIK